MNCIKDTCGSIARNPGNVVAFSIGVISIALIIIGILGGYNVIPSISTSTAKAMVSGGLITFMTLCVIQNYRAN